MAVERAHALEEIHFVVAGHRVIGRIERHRNLKFTKWERDSNIRVTFLVMPNEILARAEFFWLVVLIGADPAAESLLASMRSLVHDVLAAEGEGTRTARAFPFALLGDVAMRCVVVARQFFFALEAGLAFLAFVRVID